jgi:hypothetical protein
VVQHPHTDLAVVVRYCLDAWRADSDLRLSGAVRLTAVYRTAVEFLVGAEEAMGKGWGEDKPRKRNQFGTLTG